jgi:hypothetical protein
MRIVLRVPAYLHPLRIRLPDGREGGLVSRTVGPGGATLCEFEVPGSGPAPGRYVFSEVRVPFPDVRPEAPAERGPTLACFDCGALIPAADAYHKRNDPSCCLCEACFRRWESGRRLDGITGSSGQDRPEVSTG